MSDLLKAQYGPEFLDRMSGLRCQIDGNSGEEAFFLGFRTCAHLLLEALG